MPTGTIIAAWQDDLHAFIAVRVGSVEYIGSVDRSPEFDALTTAQKKAALVAAAKAFRDVQVSQIQTLPITGTATI